MSAKYAKVHNDAFFLHQTFGASWGQALISDLTVTFSTFHISAGSVHLPLFERSKLQPF
jgi:hypothetical protein